MKRILIVPDKFKGSLTSLQAAEAIRAGFERQEQAACQAGADVAGGSSAAGHAEGTVCVQSADGGHTGGRFCAPESIFIGAGHVEGAVCAQSADGGNVDGRFCARGEDFGSGLQFQLVEIADGGDGSLDVVAGKVDSPQKVYVQVHDPLFREISSQILLYGGNSVAGGDGFDAGGEICVAGGGISQGRADFEADSRPEFCGDAFRADIGPNSRLNLSDSITRADFSSDSRSVLLGQEKGAEFQQLSRPEPRSTSCLEREHHSSQVQSKKNTPLCAFIEMAKISGLAMLDKSERNPLNTSTYGLGEAICIAREMGAKKITLSIGGSATDDCGAGMLQAIGFEFFNHAGEIMPTPICGKDLQDVAHIDLPDKPLGCRIEVICDVDNPLLGENGATAVYAPQKGATPEALVQLEKGKANMAEVAERCLHIFPQMKLLPGAGAAGGVGYAGTAFLGGKLLSGWKFFTEITSLEEKVQWADVVVTGEGSVDSQSLSGKIVGGIMELARKWGKPVEIFCGISSLEQLPQGVRCHSLVSIEPNTQICITRAAELLEKLAAGVELK